MFLELIIDIEYFMKMISQIRIPNSCIYVSIFFEEFIIGFFFPTACQWTSVRTFISAFLQRLFFPTVEHACDLGDFHAFISDIRR